MSGGSRAHTLRRRDVVERILRERGDALVVSGLGGTSWDVAAGGDDARNFYLWGGMGGAAPLGLGLALARPERRVLVFTGDGEMLMGLGALATIAVQAPPNLVVIVIDNERYAETGMQVTHTGAGVDLAAVAAGAGIANSLTITTGAELASALPLLRAARETVFAAIKVSTDRDAMVLPPKDGAYLKHRFREAVLGTP